MNEIMKKENNNNSICWHDFNKIKIPENRKTKTKKFAQTTTFYVLFVNFCHFVCFEQKKVSILWRSQSNAELKKNSVFGSIVVLFVYFFF